MSKTITAQSRHTLFIDEDKSGVARSLVNGDKYTKFYVVKNWDANGVIFFYMAKGHKDAPGQYVIWYAKTGAFWSGYGSTMKEAIDGAQKDGWLYA